MVPCDLTALPPAGKRAAHLAGPPSSVLTPTCQAGKGETGQEEKRHTHRKMTTEYFTSRREQVPVPAGQTREEEGAERGPSGDTSSRR